MGEAADDLIGYLIAADMDDLDDDGDTGWFQYARNMELRQIRRDLTRFQREQDLKRIAELAAKYGLRPQR